MQDGAKVARPPPITEDELETLIQRHRWAEVEAFFLEMRLPRFVFVGFAYGEVCRLVTT